MRKFWKAVALGAAVGVLFVLERRRPLRRPREPGTARVARNVVIGLLAAASTTAGDLVVVGPASRFAARHRIGLLRQFPLPRAVRVVLGFLLLDYTLYLWHRVNHQVPLLWRFHAVHHVDLDLDSTTGVRFHVGELVMAAAFRAAQILLLGVEREALRAWQPLLFLSVLFHHSNVELPASVDRRLATIVATPRMHGIHRSQRPEELHTNFTSLVSWWDRVHGTIRLDVPQASITTGVAGFDTPAEVSLERSLLLPFDHDPRLASSLLRLDA